jgi:conjugative transfer signal peptidase TraF
VPIGLYIVGRATQLQIDDLAVVTPPEDVAAFLADGGYLPRGVPLLKRVLALPGQTVCRIGRTITVDSIAVGDARERDSHGRALRLWQGCRVVAEGDVFLMNRQSADSFDGRYFGPLPIASVVGRAKPLWIVRED